MKNRILSLLLAMLMIVSVALVTTSCLGGGGGTTPGGTTPGGTTPGGNNQNKTYPWNETSLFFQMSSNSNKNELTSGCERYLAGRGNNSQRVDNLIKERNAKAELDTKTKINYDFWPDSTSEHTWSLDIEPIMDKTLTPGLTSAPDMYCTFVYDMVGAMLQGCFANVLASTRGQNYFRFLDQDYKQKMDQYANTTNDFDDAVEDEGYMYQYMTSLTLSANKMYLVGSDYFTDLIRAFFVVPVNMKLLLENGKTVTAAHDAQGGSDFDALVRIVSEGKWNYELLKEYSQAVAQENTETNKVDLGGRVGFALAGGSGLSSSGMLYTTNITIIKRTGNNLTDYVYSYPETNEDLTKFAVNLKSLMETRGTYVHVAASGTDLDEIRTAFAGNHVLFGGVICVGSLEDEVYQGMKTDKGFGVLPVPLYRTVNPETNKADPYLTQIHNIGRIGAIAVNTEKFSQCTAYLNYQSTHSTDILNEYYNTTLTKNAAGESDAAAGNVQMLTYIRANVRSAFDKIFEDAVGNYAEMSSDLWHKVIQSGTAGAVNTAPYCIGENITGVYAGLCETKSKVLKSLVNSFSGYGD